MKLLPTVKKLPMLGLVVALSVATTLGVSHFAGATGSERTITGAVNTFDYLETEGTVNFCPENDDTFYDVTGLSKTFVQGGAAVDESVLVDIWPVYGDVTVRLVIDNVVQPGNAQSLYGSGAYNTGNFLRYASEPLGPGSHTVKLQAKTDSNDCLNSAYNVNMAIFHK